MPTSSRNDEDVKIDNEEFPTDDGA